MYHYRTYEYARRILELLQPHSLKIDIAGSIRREKFDSNDVDIVCIPKRTFRQTDLFGNGNWIVEDKFQEAFHRIQDQTLLGHLDGRHIKFLTKGGVKVDLFMPSENDYYRILAIRTGSLSYSQMVLAYAWKRLGWVGAGEDGLRKRSDCMEVSGKWKLINPDAEKPPAWESEEAFFHWLGLKWVHPRERYVKELFNKTL